MTDDHGWQVSEIAFLDLIVALLPPEVGARSIPSRLPMIRT